MQLLQSFSPISCILGPWKSMYVTDPEAEFSPLIFMLLFMNIGPTYKFPHVCMSLQTLSSQAAQLQGKSL